MDPAAGRVEFGAFARQWLAERSTLRPRTRELYECELRVHLLPTFEHVPLGAITPSMVRQWHAGKVRAGKPGPVTVAKLYRLLRTILSTAVEDGLLVRNPCMINGAGNEPSPERPVASIDQVFAIADAVEPRYRMLVLLATFASLRLGELSALTRDRIDLDRCTVKVTHAAVDLTDGSRVVGAPKTAAGVRTVGIPAVIVPMLREHLDLYAQPGPRGLVFVGPRGGPLRRGNWSNTWQRAIAGLGLDGFHFHDLRHTGNTLAATTGASTRELMARMGHASTRAALLYQHATPERELAIAAKLSTMIEASLSSNAES